MYIYIYMYICLCVNVVACRLSMIILNARAYQASVPDRNRTGI